MARAGDLSALPDSRARLEPAGKRLRVVAQLGARGGESSGD